MSLKKNVVISSLAICLVTCFFLIFKTDIKNSSYKSKNEAIAPDHISHESSIIAQLIWNNVLKGMPLEERDVGIPSFIDGMRGVANYPAADFEAHFGNIKNGDEYFNLHKRLKDYRERAETEQLANFPYEKYHELLKEVAFYEGFKTWAHFEDAQHAILEEVVAALNLLKEERRSPTLHSLVRKDIDELHESIYQKKYGREVRTAENYFSEIAGNQGIETIKENRLYLQRLNAVPGKRIEKDSELQISYRMETFYGHVIYDSKGPELVELDRAMQGLQEGLIHLQEGEKGILYIHPQWTDLDLLSPPYIQSFLVLLIEVVEVITPLLTQSP